MVIFRKEKGYPVYIINLIKYMYDEAITRMRTTSGEAESFSITTRLAPMINTRFLSLCSSDG